ncbi:hypothetical protein [Devosia psychrophila]|uniref:hypothetical protein n=1 Tax=Devosia psychrophila TaxID=728005 RepID=UPI000A7D19A6|nr:hypothetical protein [Devosia psychrophila]
MTDIERKPAGQPYELFAFARRHQIALERARFIIEQFGADRPGADAAAKALSESDF